MLRVRSFQMQRLQLIGLGALVGGALVAIAYNVEGPIDETIASLNFGSVGEWAAAIITASAIVLGARQFAATHQLDRQSLDEATAARTAETEWNEKKALEEARGRAAQIQVRVSLASEPLDPGWVSSDADPLRSISCQVFNLSDRPVFEAWLSLIVAPGFGFKNETSGPLGSVLKSVRFGGIPVSESPSTPSASVELQITGDLGVEEMGVSRADERIDRFVGEVVFRDSAGTLWRARSDRPPTRCAGEFRPVDGANGEYLVLVEDIESDADLFPYPGDVPDEQVGLD